jgi:hypothetical protein
MTKDIDINDNNEKSSYDATADRRVFTVEMYRERKYHGEHIRRMVKLKKMADIREKVFSRMLERRMDQPVPPKGPHLRIVK